MKRSSKPGIYRAVSLLPMAIGLLCGNAARAQGPTDGLAIRNIVELSTNIVEIRCVVAVAVRPCYFTPPQGGIPTAAVVPMKLNIVITSVDFLPEFPAAAGTISVSLIPLDTVLFRSMWIFPNTTTTVFQYPHGIVLPQGFKAGTFAGSIGNPNVPGGVFGSLTLRGYFTAAPPVITGPLPN
jgi:hypothetical protein